MFRHSLIKQLLRLLWFIRSYLTRPHWRRLHPLITNPKIVAMEVALLSFWLFIGRGDRPQSVTLVWTHERYEVAEDFLGVAIDAAMLTDGDWWENSNSPPRPLDFEEPSLRRWSTLLRPAWVRLGGSEADKIWLAEAGDAVTSGSVLTRPLFNRFLEFTKAIGARPFITASNGPGTRIDNRWQPDQFKRLLDWLPADYSGHLEFGNEPGAHWLLFGRRHQIGFDQLAGEYQAARALTQQSGIALAGPANAFWPEIGEPLKQIVGSSKDFLRAGANPDIFTWHYYPTQSRRCRVRTEGANWDGLLDLDTMKEFQQRTAIITRWLRQYSPNSLQWLGETGPAQCGGRTQFTDRFGSSLWWLAHLGVAAQGGNQTVIRQSLVGGDYALLDYDSGYSPNPDYWASLLWIHNMGAKGFRVAEADGEIRAIAHCRRDRPGELSMVIVNLGDQSANVSLPQASEGYFIDVTSTDLSSRYTLIDGKLAEVFDWQDMTSLPWRPLSDWHGMTGHSYRWVIIGAVPGCQ